MTILNKIKQSKLYNYLFLFSGFAAITLLLARVTEANYPGFRLILNVFASVATLCFVTFKYNFLGFLQNVKNKKIIYILSGISTITAILYSSPRAYSFLTYELQNFTNLSTDLIGLFLVLAISLLALISVLAMQIFFIWSYNILLKLAEKIYANLCKSEKVFIIICCVLSVICLTYIYNQTTVFYRPYNDSNGATFYGVLYSADSSLEVGGNSDSNISVGAEENDIRQPLFGVFALPFATLSLALSKILFFIPNSYPIILQIIQILSLQISFILLAKLLKLNKISHVLFLLLMLLRYPSFFFTLTLEQYIFPTFWLMVFIYAALSEGENQDEHVYFIAASGSLLTSSAFFPLLFINNKDKAFNLLSKVLLKALAILIILGRFFILPHSVITIPALLNNFGGSKISFTDKLLQFINFVASCIITPATSVSLVNDRFKYGLSAVDTVNIIGVVLIALALLGFALNYKNKLAQVCISWIGFSFVLLAIVGWGSKENCMLLYTLYFSWAFVTLAVLAFERLFAKLNVVRYSLYSAFIVALLYVNLPGICDVISFGIKYYPAK